MEGGNCREKYLGINSHKTSKLCLLENEIMDLESCVFLESFINFPGLQHLYQLSSVRFLLPTWGCLVASWLLREAAGGVRGTGWKQHC